MKRETILLEKSHALGRIWDIDVIGEEGMISRERMGIQGRRCFLCGLDAKVMREEVEATRSGNCKTGRQRSF